jgi:hypothetical protein
MALRKLIHEKKSRDTVPLMFLTGNVALSMREMQWLCRSVTVVFNFVMNEMKIGIM